MPAKQDGVSEPLDVTELGEEDLDGLPEDQLRDVVLAQVRTLKARAEALPPEAWLVTPDKDE